MRNAVRCPRVVAGSVMWRMNCMRTCRRGIEKHTPVRGRHHGSDLHASRRRGGRALLLNVCMYACEQENGRLGHLLDPGLDLDRGQQCASWRRLALDLLRLRLHDTTTRGYPCPRC